MMKWIVIAIGNGDSQSENSYTGERIWSQEFNSEAAAQEALTWFKDRGVRRVIVIADGSPQ